MSEDLLSEIPREGANPFESLEKDTPVESTPTKEPNEVTKDKPEEGINTPEDNLPFHKHPRWIERENELKTEREAREQMGRELAELKELKKEKSSVEVDPRWKALWGDNPEAYQKWLELENERKDQVKREIVEEQQKAEQQKVAEAQHWSKWVDDEIKKLQDAGNQFDRNKLIKTMLDYRPTDENGNFDFNLGMKIYKTENPDNSEKTEAKKQVADMVTKSGSKQDTPKKGFKTSEEMRRKSWASLGNLD